MMERKFRVGRRAALVGAASLAAPFVRARAQGAEPMTLRVDVGPWGVHAALYLAQQRGWFRDAGLAVNLQDGTGTLSTINLVGAGRVDVGFVQLGPMAIGRASGVPVKSFAGFIRKGDLAVIVDRETGAKTPRELAGKKLTCFSASAWAPFIDTYLRSAGLRRGSGEGEVNVVMVTPPAMVTSYASGAADGFMSIQPYGEPLVATTRPGRSLLAVDSGIQFPSYGFIATDATIAGRADALRRLNATQVRGWTEMQAANPGFYLQQSVYTIDVTLAGFALAVVIGVALAIAIVASPLLDRVFYTLLVALNAVPKVAPAPIFVIWHGTSSPPKIAIGPEMIAMARSACAPRRHIMLKIRFPNALPSLFAGMKVGVSFALIGAIVGEFVAGENGLGTVILNSQANFNTPRAFAAIVLLSLTGTLLFFIVDGIERWLLPWHVSQRGQAH